MATGDPVISVDAKKKELVGAFKNGGREWHPAGDPEQVKVQDFIDPELGKANPYGVYDVANNIGWVWMGTDHDTAAFAVNTIATWWQQVGKRLHPNASRVLICADGGGSDGYRTRLWKTELAALARSTGLTITVCHLPPGTSKWNKEPFPRVRPSATSSKMTPARRYTKGNSNDHLGSLNRRLRAATIPSAARSNRSLHPFTADGRVTPTQ